MSTNLTATAPTAFENLFNIIDAASANSTPPIFVSDSFLLQWEPGIYIELGSIENHRFEVDSLGAYAFKEYYDLRGVVRVYRGDTDTKQARDDAWSIYQANVMTQVVGDRRLSDLLLWIIPGSASGESTTTNNGGCQHVVTFTYSCAARLTV